jgi:hypothetical protein
MSGNGKPGIVTLRYHSPLRGGIKSYVDERIAMLQKTGSKWLLDVYLNLRKTGKIKVRALSARIMRSPEFLGASVLRVRRGAPVAPLEFKGAWVKVRYRGRVGWIDKNYIFPRAIRISSGGTGTGTSRGEMELSGRG